jgi:hypothetical protein
LLTTLNHQVLFLNLQQRLVMEDLFRILLLQTGAKLDKAKISLTGQDMLTGLLQIHLTVY